MPKPQILFASYGAGHVNALKPVAEYLSDYANVSFLALTSAQVVRFREKVQRLGMLDFLPAEDHATRQFGVNLLERFHNESSGIPREEAIAYLGLSYAELLEHNLGDESVTNQALTSFGRGAFYPIRTANRILETVQPDVVVTTNSPRMERALIDACAGRSTRSVMVIDTFANGDITRLADYYCVIDDRVGRSLDGLHVVATGNPAFDYLRKIKLEGSAFHALYLAQIGPLPGAGQQLTPWTNGEILERIKAASRIADGWGLRFAVRAHPNQLVDLAWAIEQSGFMDWSSKPLEECLARCRAVFGHGSTVQVQSALLGIPTIAQLSEEGQNIFPLETLTNGIVVRSFSDLSKSELPPVGSAAHGSDACRKVADVIMRAVGDRR